MAAVAPSAAAAAGAAAAAFLQRQLFSDDAGRGADAGWTEHQTGDGRKFYFHEATATSVWEKPDVLKDMKERANTTPWKEYKIWDGRVFYHHSETKVSCWTIPPDVRKARSELSGIDERPLAATQSEMRQSFVELLKAKGVNEAWTWTDVERATCDESASDGLPDEVRKQCFLEIVSLSMRKQLAAQREKQRNVFSALERLIEEKFGSPEDLETTYQEAKHLLQNQEAWNLVKSDIRRDEVFQSVMERLEEKHHKARAERRSDRVLRLQRLMATDPELTRLRLCWKDTRAILARRDELQEEDPPLEALRVWASLRKLRPAAEHDADQKAKDRPDPIAFREERHRRDNFVTCLRESVARGIFTTDTLWVDFEASVERDPRYLALREGPGATSMELFDEIQADLRHRGYAEVIGNIDPTTLGPPPTLEPAGGGPPVKRQRHGFDPTPNAGDSAATSTIKQELSNLKEEDTSALDEFIAAAAGAHGGPGPMAVKLEETD